MKYQQYHSNDVESPSSKISEKSKKNFRVIFNTIGVDLLSESDKLRYSDNFLSVSDSCNLCPICYNGGNNKITTVIRSRSQYWLWREQVEMIGALSHRD